VVDAVEAGADVLVAGAADVVDEAGGLAVVEVDVAGAAVEDEVAGGFDVVDVVEDEVQDASRTTDNINARHRTMNLILNNFFILRSLLISFSRLRRYNLVHTVLNYPYMALSSGYNRLSPAVVIKTIYEHHL
jgi:hypothetical protein